MNNNVTLHASQQNSGFDAINCNDWFTIFMCFLFAIWFNHRV